MNLPQRKSNRISEYNYSQNGAYFITICTYNRMEILSTITVGTPLPGCPQEPGLEYSVRSPHVELSGYGIIADKVIRQMDVFYDHLSVEKYVIMPDHIHLLIRIYGVDGHPGRGVPTKASEKSSVIARFVGTFKRFCNKEYEENIWQERYYDHVIRNQQDYDEIWQYIDNNPRKWLIQNRRYE